MRFAVPKAIQAALEGLYSHGHQAYLVGGCVRDDLLGIPPHDYDIATSASPEAVMACFPGARLLLSGLKHGTVTVLLEQTPVEITSFRRDGTYSDGRHPDAVAFTDNFAEDVARRDFTINALAFSPRTGLVDLVGGVDDLRARRIRAVGDPVRRFSEDALRILRAVRFACVLGFTLEEATRRAMILLAGNLAHISVERVAAEWNGALVGEYASSMAQYPKVVFHAVPELRDAYGETDASTLASSAAVVQALPRDLPLRWVGLFLVGRPEGVAAVNAATERLRLSKALRQNIAVIAEHAHQKLDATLVRLWLTKLGLPMLLRIITLQKVWAGDDPGRTAALQQLEEQALALVAQGTPLTLRDLAVNGNDLIAAGIPKGPRVGETLGYLMQEVIAQRLPNRKDALLDAARQHIGSSEA